VRRAADPADNSFTLIMVVPITISSIGGVHTVITESGKNHSIQRQLITLPTPRTKRTQS
jgi:hypothetical protein